MTARCITLAALSALILASLATAPHAAAPPSAPRPGGDWPTWRGPARDGVSAETGLLREWPKDGPRRLWTAKGLGGGYSTPAVVGTRIYVVGTKGKFSPGGGFGGFGGGKGGGGKGGGFGKGGPSATECIYCLDAAKKGEILWTAEIGKTAGAFAGPRSSPAVADGRVYALSSDGVLACVRADNGERIWKKDLVSAYGGKKGMFAYTESPLVDGDVVICTPGGGKATLVALKAKDGAEVWKAAVPALKMKESKGGFGGGKGGFGGGFGGPKEYNTAAYSSAIAAEVGGVKQYIQFLTGGVVGVDAKTGKMLWHYDDPANSQANCSTPIFKDGCVFAASGYNHGGGKATIKSKDGKFEAKQDFFVSELQNLHGNMVLVGKHVYGTGNSTLMCVSFEDGKIAWDKRSVGKGAVACADGHIYLRGERGDVVLVEANPSKYVEKGRFRQPERSDQQTWASPVIADKKLYLRDWDVLLCYDLAAK